jgi:pentatricopeptide repeat protein
LEFALEVWEEFAKSGIQPNNIILNSMIAVCADLPKSEAADGFPRERIDLAEKFFRKIQKPDVINYSTFFDVYARAGLREQTQELEAEMKSRGIKMNAIIYNSLMNGCIIVKDFQGALSYFEKARLSGELNTVIFSTAMQAYYKLKDLAAVRALWSELCLNYKPNHISLAIYLKALATRGLVTDIDSVITNQDTELSTAGWNGVIHELHCHGYIAGADYFFQKMFSMGKFRLWSTTEKDTIELHGFPGAVACCAVRYVLFLEKPREEYNFIVGRQLRTRTNSFNSVGDSVRELLSSFGIYFTEKACGGNLVIAADEVSRFRSRMCK